MQRVFTKGLPSMLPKNHEEIEKEHFNTTHFQFYGDFCSVTQFRAILKNVVQDYSTIQRSPPRTGMLYLNLPFISNSLTTDINA